MIIKGLFNLIYTFLSVVLTPFQIIPDVPQSVDSFLESFLDFIFAPIQIVSFLFPCNFIIVALPVFLVILNMEHIWDGIIWILKKLPFVGIE
jgi:hypothetical protein